MKSFICFFASSSLILLILTASVAAEVPSIVTMECQFAIVLADNYRCTLDGYWSVTSPNQTLRIVGQHLPGMGDDNVTELIPHRSIMFLGGEIMTKFRNLRSLNLYRVSLREILPNAFDSCARLESLTFGGSRMGPLPNGMLRNCINLRFFNGDLTFISSLPGDLFGTTERLESFAFTFSELETLPPLIFRHTSRLHTVNLNRNLITTLDAGLFSNVGGLRSVDLGMNRIADENIIVNALRNQPNLQVLNFRGNRLPSIDFHLFAQFSALESLRLSTQRAMTDIAWHSLPASLTELSVQTIGEPLPEGSLDHLVRLERLGLHGNSIRTLHVATFRGLVNLRFLDLTSCGLTALAPELFTPLTNLIHLTLAWNTFDYLPAGVFASLTRLGTETGEGLILASNAILRLNSEAFGVHPNLTSLDIRFNNIRAIDQEIFRGNLPRVTTLHAHRAGCVEDEIILTTETMHSEPRLEYCFANWRGETTSTTTTTDGGEMVKANVIILAGLVLMKYI